MARWSRGVDGAVVVNRRTLDKPLNSNVMYTPLQMCVILQSEEAHASSLMCIKNRSHLRKVKDAMVDEMLVPLKISQLNNVYARWKKDSTCQLYWGTARQMRSCQWMILSPSFWSSRAERLNCGERMTRRKLYTRPCWLLLKTTEQ